MEIFDAMFRFKIGFPSKAKMLDNKIFVYEEIIRLKNEMEKQAYIDFQSDNNIDWFLLQAKKKKINRNFIDGIISEKNYLECLEACYSELKILLANYIDNQSDNSIYGFFRNRLKKIKKENIHLLNISNMDFDLWFQIEKSVILAQLTINQIVNSREYLESLKNDKFIKKFQRLKKIKRRGD